MASVFQSSVLSLLLIVAACGVSRGAADNRPDGELGHKVVELTAATLDDAIARGPLLFELYANWCKHCVRFAPQYQVVAEHLGPDGVIVGRADGSLNRILLQRFGAAGYPSFYLIDGGKAFEYNGDRSVENLVEFARSHGTFKGKEVGGLAGPASPVWKVVSVLLAQWDRVVGTVKESDMSPVALGATFAAIILGILVVFGVVIHFVTKPAEVRPKTN